MLYYSIMSEGKSVDFEQVKQKGTKDRALKNSTCAFSLFRFMIKNLAQSLNNWLFSTL